MNSQIDNKKERIEQFLEIKKNKFTKIYNEYLSKKLDNITLFNNHIKNNFLNKIQDDYKNFLPLFFNNKKLPDELNKIIYENYITCISYLTKYNSEEQLYNIDTDGLSKISNILESELNTIINFIEEDKKKELESDDKLKELLLKGKQDKERQDAIDKQQAMPQKQGMSRAMYQAMPQQQGMSRAMYQAMPQQQGMSRAMYQAMQPQQGMSRAMYQAMPQQQAMQKQGMYQAMQPQQAMQQKQGMYQAMQPQQAMPQKQGMLQSRGPPAPKLLQSKYDRTLQEKSVLFKDEVDQQKYTFSKKKYSTINKTSNRIYSFKFIPIIVYDDDDVNINILNSKEYDYELDRGTLVYNIYEHKLFNLEDQGYTISLINSEIISIKYFLKSMIDEEYSEIIIKIPLIILSYNNNTINLILDKNNIQLSNGVSFNLNNYISELIKIVKKYVQKLHIQEYI